MTAELKTKCGDSAQEGLTRKQILWMKKMKHILTLDFVTLHHSLKKEVLKNTVCVWEVKGGTALWVHDWFFKVLVLRKKKKRDTKHCGRLATSNSRSRCFLGFSCREREEIRVGTDAEVWIMRCRGKKRKGEERIRENPLYQNPT